MQPPCQSLFSLGETRQKCTEDLLTFSPSSTVPSTVQNQTRPLLPGAQPVREGQAQKRPRCRALTGFDFRGSLPLGDFCNSSPPPTPRTLLTSEKGVASQVRKPRPAHLVPKEKIAWLVADEATAAQVTGIREERCSHGPVGFGSPAAPGKEAYEAIYTHNH